MKILYVSTARIPSKTANSVHIVKMCQAFAKQGNEVHLIAIKDDYSIENIYEYYNVKNNFKIHFFSNSSVEYLYLFNKLLNKLNPDLVYGRYLHGCTIASIKGYKTIYEVHIINFFTTLVSKISFGFLYKSKNFLNLISITNTLKKDIINNYPKLEKKILVLPDGADIPNTSNSKNKLIDCLHEKLDVGYVGSMHQGKGIETVVNLANQMKEVKFHVIGGKNKEIEYWKSKSLYQNIYFYGFIQQNELKNYITYFNICLLPNQKDVLIDGLQSSNIGKYTSPLKMFEYMSYKKAIIASDLVVIREILNENNSVLVQPNNLKEWIDAINNLKDDKLRKEIASNAYNDFTKKYSWNRRVERLLNEYNDKFL